MASVDSLLDGLSSYTYDVTNQLTAVDHATITDEAHAWDSNGNRDGGSDTVGTDNRLTSDGTYNYEYDDEGNRTKKTTIATGAYVTYAWDYRNRLTTVAFYNSSHVLQKKIEYDYDVFDRRMAKRVDANGCQSAL